MNSTPESRTIVVGFDGSEVSYAALDWALDEAVGRHAEVAAVLASGGAAGSTPQVPMWADWPDDAARALLADARTHAAGRARGVPFRTVTSMASAARALIETSTGAALVVIGGTRHRRLGELLLGATAPQVVAHAHCPVIVIPSGHVPVEDRPVVVGVDGSSAARGAVDFAFARAAATSRRLIAVHAWWLDAPSRIAPMAFGPEVLDQIEAENRALVDGVVSDAASTFPDVDVEQVLVRGNPVEALLEAGEKAALLVVGSRGHGGFAGLLLGSVSQGVLHAHLPCPIAVVRSTEVGHQA